MVQEDGVVLDKKGFKCSVCGLHYVDNETAEKCYAYCSAQNACSIEITKESLELKDAAKH